MIPSPQSHAECHRGFTVSLIDQQYHCFYINFIPTKAGNGNVISSFNKTIIFLFNKKRKLSINYKFRPMFYSTLLRKLIIIVTIISWLFKSFPFPLKYMWKYMVNQENINVFY